MCIDACMYLCIYVCTVSIEINSENFKFAASAIKENYLITHAVNIELIIVIFCKLDKLFMLYVKIRIFVASILSNNGKSIEYFEHFFK